MNRASMGWAMCGFFVMGMLAAACQPTKPVIPPATVVISGCEHFGLITASPKDTVPTKTQILAHNAEYLKTCPRSSVKSPSK